MQIDPNHYLHKKRRETMFTKIQEQALTRANARAKLEKDKVQQDKQKRSDNKDKTKEGERDSNDQTLKLKKDNRSNPNRNDTKSIDDAFPDVDSVAKQVDTQKAEDLAHGITKAMKD